MYIDLSDKLLLNPMISHRFTLLYGIMCYMLCRHIHSQLRNPPCSLGKANEMNWMPHITCSEWKAGILLLQMELCCGWNHKLGTGSHCYSHSPKALLTSHLVYVSFPQDSSFLSDSWGPTRRHLFVSGFKHTVFPHFKI